MADTPSAQLIRGPLLSTPQSAGSVRSTTNKTPLSMARIFDHTPMFSVRGGLELPGTPYNPPDTAEANVNPADFDFNEITADASDTALTQPHYITYKVDLTNNEVEVQPEELENIRAKVAIYKKVSGTWARNPFVVVDSVPGNIPDLLNDHGNPAKQGPTPLDQKWTYFGVYPRVKFAERLQPLTTEQKSQLPPEGTTPPPPPRKSSRTRKKPKLGLLPQWPGFI